MVTNDIKISQKLKKSQVEYIKRYYEIRKSKESSVF